MKMSKRSWQDFFPNGENKGKYTPRGINTEPNMGLMHGLGLPHITCDGISVILHNYVASATHENFTNIIIWDMW